MAKLIITDAEGATRDFPLSKERVTIGRHPDNDISLNDKAVSGRHAVIITILRDSFLEDLNSTNGTYVNGKLIKKHALQHGDVLTCGHHQLRFVEDDSAQQDEFERTLVIQPSARPVEKIRAAVSSGAEATASRRTLGNGAPALKKARLQVLSGAFAGRELELTKTLTTLGRPGVQVAAITRRSEGYFLVHVDADSAENFPQVNGAPIGAQARKLVDNDVIQLAGVKMGFFEG
jgi:pSer/pThr/pTyr-binding forkhead associated (FHA) protein